MAIWLHRDTVKRSWGTLSCHSSATITSCFRMIIMHVSMIYTQVLEAGNVQVLPWPAYSPDMSPIEHLLRYSGSRCTTACSSSHQYPTTSHSNWRRAGQHSRGHNQQPDQLYAKEMSCCTPDTDWFSDPRFYLFLRYLWPTDAICIPSHVKSIDKGLMNLFQLTDFLKWTITQ